MKKDSIFKNKKFLTSLFGIFIISIMVFSVLNVYTTRENTDKIKYKDYTFYKKDNYWTSNINGKQLVFRYNPTELQDINLVNYNIYDRIYLSYSPEQFNQENYVIKETLSLFSYTNKKTILSCYEEKDCPDIPLIDCKINDAILLKYNENKTNIYIEDKCLILEGNQESQLKYIYKMIYDILGI